MGRDAGCGCSVWTHPHPESLPTAPSLIPSVCPQHHLVRAARPGMALQDAASRGNHLAGGERDEAQPQPDRDGQGDLSRCCRTPCGCAWVGTRLLGPLGKPSGSAHLIQPGLVLLLCSAWAFPLLQPIPRMWGWRWVLMGWKPPASSQPFVRMWGCKWDPHGLGTFPPSQPFPGIQ